MTKCDDISIETGRLLVRTLSMKDKEAFYKYRSMPEVYKYQSMRPKNISEIEEFIKKNANAHLNMPDTWLQLAVCLKEGQMIGDIGIHFIDDKYQIEIGYTLSPEYQGMGFAAEAVKAIIDYAFNELKKYRIIASVDPDNLSSVKLLERIGFRKEAHFIKSYRMNDKWYDDCVYAILKDEWKTED
ncbi:GNAT family N-acetyltransferase [Sedimentibacter hydroxybenzoicus DSM 7310]|uniref:GNAT family N-acetyltransferase n=1 Tax=Sedimentibacter hydroxybenzoicus DSM 7310 TaxID=1123245 RepID=A0A974GX74_SEDHY|nr:GNAT family protein [Sedimentibacter hydroxybenzoicus]NYB75233.1 GNAT family N-acetyltransferase [Sedimentibacter hydroxybenzoicus DSM 7310]